MRYSQPKPLRRFLRQSLFLIISLSLILSPINQAYTASIPAQAASNYSRAYSLEEMKNGFSYQADECLKGLFAFLFGGGKDCLEGGVGFRSLFRTEAVGYFAVYHATS